MSERWTDETLKALGIGGNFAPRLKAVTAILVRARGEIVDADQKVHAYARRSKSEELRAQATRLFQAVQLAALRTEYPDQRGQAAEKETGWYHYLTEHLSIGPRRAREIMEIGRWVEAVYPDQHARLLAVGQQGEFGGTGAAKFTDDQPLIPATMRFAPLDTMSWNACKLAAKRWREQQEAPKAPPTAQEVQDERTGQKGLDLDETPQDGSQAVSGSDPQGGADSDAGLGEDDGGDVVRWDLHVGIEDLIFGEYTETPEGLRDALCSAVGEAVGDVLAGHSLPGLHLSLTITGAPRR